MSCFSAGQDHRKVSIDDKKKLLQHEEAIESYKSMRRSGITPATHVLLAALKACSCLKDLETGTSIHAYMHEKKTHLKPLLWNSLVCMYAKCGSLADARVILDEMPQQDVVSWNAMIFGYVQSGEGELALQVFSQMQQAGFTPDSLTFVAAMKACATAAANDTMKWSKRSSEIHSQIEWSGHDSNLIVANTLVHMFARCGRLKDAKAVFNRMEKHDVFSWTALISGYAEGGGGSAEIAVSLFSEMQLESCLKPNYVTLVAVFKACAASCGEGKTAKLKMVWLEKGMAIHSHAVELGFKLLEDINVGNSLLNMYAKCGSVFDARWVFERMRHRTVISWNSLIFGYVDSGDYELALKLFVRMQEEGLKYDALTYVAALKTCANLAPKEDGDERLKWLEKTVAIHAEVAGSGEVLNVIVANNLLQAYAKCGSLFDARKVFQGMKKRSLVSWNTMINACADGEQEEIALQLLELMQKQGFKADAATYVAALKACAALGDLAAGKQIHEEIKAASGGIDKNSLVQTSLVDFYGKCGSMAEAEEVFASIIDKDLVSWCALLGGYSLHGDAGNVFRLFESMISSEEGRELKLNGVVFLHVLTACSHAGLVDEGKYYFELMSSKFSIPPGLKHHSCLVDLLGRANRLSEAVEIVQRMPWKADSTIWTTILAASRKWGNAAVGRTAFEVLVGLDENDATPYILLAGAYDEEQTSRGG